MSRDVSVVFVQVRACSVREGEKVQKHLTRVHEKLWAARRVAAGSGSSL